MGILNCRTTIKVEEVFHMSSARGQVLPLVALSLSVLFGFAGLGVNVGYWEYQQNSQQSATDAAAIGGAQQLLYAGCPNSVSATTAAVSDAATNGFSNTSNANMMVTVSNPPTGGPYSGSPCAVSVEITTKKVAGFFSSIFGYSKGATVLTQAVASLTAGRAGCIYMLASGQNTNFNGSNINAPYCSILLNGSANFNGSTVDAAMIGEVNYSGSNNGGTFTQASPEVMIPVGDPCYEISGCAYLTANPPSTSPCTGTYSGNGTLSPGCYNNLNMNGATVTLTPGLYVFPGSSNFNKASITANGVTIYIPAGASTNFNKVNGLTLSGQTNSSAAGVAYFQVKANSGDVNFNGSNTNVSGLIYAPTAQLNYNGSSDLYTIVVAAYANLNGSGGENFASPAPGQAIVTQQAVLAQ